MIERLIGQNLSAIYGKVRAGERLSFDDGVDLYRTRNLTAVGLLANLARERLHGDRAYFIRNHHINYTNVCDKACRFCSFYARRGGPAPYTLSPTDVRERLRRTESIPIREVHIVVNPKLPYDYYLELVRTVREVRPGAHIKAFTAVELVEIARVGRKTIDEALQDLVEAGVDSIPGGGIEVLSDRLHRELFHRKLTGYEWLDVARAVARAGLPQYATMLYGHIETIEERVQHLISLRELQDETGHFLAMTPLAFHPEGTELDHLPHSTGDGDLRNIAVSRLMLDNFPHVKSFWVMNTPPVTQLALWYGADDVDGTVEEYEITYADEAPGEKRQALTLGELVQMIREAGRVPVERDSLYRQVAFEEPLERAAASAS
jgi:aminodeoxyfutalosine synthase